MDSKREIETLIRSKYPILYVVSYEEKRVELALQAIAKTLSRTLHTWSLTQGMKPVLGSGAKSTLSPELEALAQVYEAPDGTIVMLRDFHHYMRDPRVLRLLRDIAGRLREKKTSLILTGSPMELHPDIEKDVSLLNFPLPDGEEIGRLLDTAHSSLPEEIRGSISLDSVTRERICKSAQGLTINEVEAVLARSIVETKTFDPAVIQKEKEQVVRKSGVLQYFQPDASLADVGGMSTLKDWLNQRTENFTDAAREFGIPAPKGILMLGVQGCGKSLTAKAIASLWNLPMLRLDVGSIFGQYVGQSEMQMRKALATAEAISPCILWVDELEKAFAGTRNSGDSGASSRVFATFLTWMQEKKSPVFIVATGNDVSALPPELLRKGRFDEIFFIDLPEKDEREDIFKIHIAKRKRDPKKFKMKPLAEASEGFNGAEIETCVVAALQRAFFQKRELTQADIVAEVEACVPLSVMMAEDISALRDWASMRARSAG